MTKQFLKLCMQKCKQVWPQDANFDFSLSTSASWTPCSKGCHSCRPDMLGGVLAAGTLGHWPINHALWRSWHRLSLTNCISIMANHGMCLPQRTEPAWSGMNDGMSSDQNGFSLVPGKIDVDIANLTQKGVPSRVSWRHQAGPPILQLSRLKHKSERRDSEETKLDLEDLGSFYRFWLRLA